MGALDEEIPPLRLRDPADPANSQAESRAEKEGDSAEPPSINIAIFSAKRQAGQSMTITMPAKRPNIVNGR
jgi:hypothetical protein